MSVPEWPASLPQAVLQEGFSYGFGDGRLKTATDAGPGKMRRRFSAVGKPVAAQIVFGLDYLPIFEAFHGEDCAGGALPFYLPDQVHLGPLSDDGGIPLVTEGGDTIDVAYLPWLVMFDTTPAITPFGALHWRASFNLIVMP